MTRYEKFLEALNALCAEHGMRMDSECIDWDQEEQYIELATEDKPAGCNIEFVERIAPTPEELEAQAAENAERDRANAARYEELRRRHEEYINTPDYKARVALVEREAKRQREDYMRISTDPTDPAYIDQRPRRVWINNVEVLNWIVADEFRRCVIAPGKHEGDTVVMHGAVLIERLPAVRFTRLPEHDNDEPGFDGWHDHVTDSLWLVPQGEDPNITHATPPADPHPEASTSLSGMLVKVEEATPEAPAATFAVPTVPVKAAAMSAKPAKKSKKAR